MSGLFGGNSQPSAPPPAVAPPVLMPIPDDVQSKAAKRRSIAEQVKAQGRASTILTDGTDKLGG